MHIKKIQVSNFMLFQSLDINFSKNINVICGENSTGKTALLKILYSSLKSINELGKIKNEITKEKTEEIFVNKFQGVFRPDKDKIGRLVGRKQGSNKTKVAIQISDSSKVVFEFGNRQEKHMDIKNVLKLDVRKIEPVYILPKEIISATENFKALYEEYHIAFEETYYDLARLLAKPLRKGKNKTEQNTILKKFEEILTGRISQNEDKFYLTIEGSGEFEMGLVSEGYRKLSTIIYLIQSGSLSKNSILFWDEPETNMNPKMIPYVVSAIAEIAKMGIQVFVTTHDYFVQQQFNLIAAYQKNNDKKMDIDFISLYRENEALLYESAKRISELEHNPIMEEFNNLYNREQELFYESE